MVGRFTGANVPACGFSIGFERIVLLLVESGFKVPGDSEKKAFLIEKGIGGEKLCEIIGKAQKARDEGQQVLVVRMNKNKKFQKEQLQAQGYENFEEFFNN
jgi:histidyl-tRNA synthetase